MTTAALVGSTGLVGSHILTTLLSNATVTSVHAYSRRDLPTAHEKLHSLTSTETSSWPSIFPSSPAPSIFFSGLGTTRAAAGSTVKQYEVDFSLNLNLARAAKTAGVTTYVLISAGGANSSSPMFYPRMKGELEDAVKELGFDHTVLVRPGLIVGERNEGRMAEGIFRGIANGFGKISSALKDPWAQDADVIARAAVAAGLECAEGKREKGVWILGGADIINLGKPEKEEKK